MNSKMMMAMALALATAAVDAVTVSGVTAQQRYPWNGKVDISYTVEGDVDDALKSAGALGVLKVTAKDCDAEATYDATSITGGASLAEGVHSIVWDLDADNIKFKSSNVIFTVSCEIEPATYCVIDLSAGSSATSYPVTYMNEIPGGSWSNEYKTTKLVLKRIEAGSYKMQNSTTVTLTKPFFIGVFEVTQKQYTLVMGSNPAGSYGVGDAYPVYYVSYNNIRGSSSGAGWPSSSSVDSTSFMGKLQARTGLNFDLPTEAQWEYACRAGTTTTYSYGDSANGDYMWSTSNSSSSTHTVGTKKPNPWGLYDMHGSVWEWNLDWYGTLAYGTDPKGSSSGSYRVNRGGSWSSYASSCASSYRLNNTPSHSYYNTGFRLSRTLP